MLTSAGAGVQTIVQDQGVTVSDIGSSYYRLTVRLGAARVDRVDEQQFPVPFALITDDEDFITRRIDPLPVAFLDRSSMAFQFSNHSWLIRVDDLTVLVDPCNGNGRRRSVPQFNDRNLPWLERLSALGVSPDAVDVVFCTHLHNDHCGWNTMEVDGRWVPTFPHATYLFVDAEYRRWDPNAPHPHPNSFNESVFDECVRPVVDAGLAKTIEPPYSVSPSLAINDAPGHTVGHAILRLESEGLCAFFTGDVFHHPAQITRPELHLPGCDDLEQAIATRRALSRRIHDEAALLFPAHFGAPHYGRLDEDGDDLIFVPEGSPAH
jgi:glyoxylase-like metal-dependent hydrolase (beta-lactamase superfamily II)